MMKRSSEAKSQALTGINEGENRDQEEKTARGSRNRRAAKGCLTVVAVLNILFSALAAVGEDKAADRPVEELQGNFRSGVTRVKLSGHATNFRIDVHTDFYPDRDVADVALGMALIAVQSRAILDAYPSATIRAYVWPKSEEFYMTRASASYTDGELDAPIDSYVNAVIQ